MRPLKYHNKPTIVDGVRFASKKEARVYGELKLLERSKVISGLTLQPRYPMVVKGKQVCVYVADYLFYENGKLVAGDAKGAKTDAYRIKRNLFLALYPHIEHREL